MSKCAVVFGSTGLVGKELVNLLLDNPGYESVITPVRHEHALIHPKLKQIVFKDFDEIRLFKNELSADDFFCCIGTTIHKAGSRAEFRKVDHDFPLYIAKLAGDLSVPNMVVISSVGANAKSPNFYLRTKGEMEASVRTAFSGNLKFVRPSLLIGNREEKRPGEKAGIVFMKYFGWIFIGNLKKYKGIHGRDLAQAMIRATCLPFKTLVLEADDLLKSF